MSIKPLIKSRIEPAIVDVTSSSGSSNVEIISLPLGGKIHSIHINARVNISPVFVQLFIRDVNTQGRKYSQLLGRGWVRSDDTDSTERLTTMKIFHIPTAPKTEIAIELQNDSGVTVTLRAIALIETPEA